MPRGDHSPNSAREEACGCVVFRCQESDVARRFFPTAFSIEVTLEIVDSVTRITAMLWEVAIRPREKSRDREGDRVLSEAASIGLDP